MNPLQLAPWIPHGHYLRLFMSTGESACIKHRPCRSLDETGRLTEGRGRVPWSRDPLDPRRTSHRPPQGTLLMFTNEVWILQCDDSKALKTIKQSRGGRSCIPIHSLCLCRTRRNTAAMQHPPFFPCSVGCWSKYVVLENNCSIEPGISKQNYCHQNSISRETITG
jgi:hypothetical protein